MPARTVSAILRCHQVAYDCDPLTAEEIIRSSKATALRYERARPAS